MITRALRGRTATCYTRVANWVERALSESHTPHEVAASFALGTVVVVLPTGGTAVLVFAVAAYLFERASKVGLLATLVVFLPPVKWAIYGAGFWLGTRLLGPVPGVSAAPTDLLAVGPPVLVRYLLGNAVIAVGLAAVGYVVVLFLLRRRVAAVRPADSP